MQNYEITKERQTNHAKETDVERHKSKMIKIDAKHLLDT